MIGVIVVHLVDHRVDLWARRLVPAAEAVAEAEADRRPNVIITEVDRARLREVIKEEQDRHGTERGSHVVTLDKIMMARQKAHQWKS